MTQQMFAQVASPVVPAPNSGPSPATVPGSAPKAPAPLDGVQPSVPTDPANLAPAAPPVPGPAPVAASPVAPVAAPASTPVDVPPPPPESVTKAVEETVEKAVSWTEQAVNFTKNHILNADVGIELVVLGATGLIAFLLSRFGIMLLDRLWPQSTTSRFRYQRTIIASLIVPILWVILLWLATTIMGRLNYENTIVRAVASLLNAWVVIRLFSSLVRDAFWSKVFAAAAWSIAALNTLNLLDPSVALLDGIAVNIGTSRISLYLVIKGAIFCSLLMWAASAISRVASRRINSSTTMSPSVQTLIGQSIRLILLFGAFVIALSTIGFDLTVLTVFSGAIGVGIGFGLQSVFSNLVAGIILLFERSIRVGDFVELSGGIQGTVREITVRSTLVTTNDNIDVLVPNSEFITTQMTNWTLRDAYRRLRIPFGVAYGTDKELVRKAGLEAASDVSHTLQDVKGREAQVWLVGFGDSSLNFELVVWLNPEFVKRPMAVHAAYCWAIETALRKYNIEIPFPQRDVHIRTHVASPFVPSDNAVEPT